MEPVNLEELDPNLPTCFLPHHCVLKPDSSTTKLRVVFNASSPTSTGYSLNDNLMVGPMVQDELYDIIIRWRFHLYVMSADIEKMYRQFWIHPLDQQLLLIVIRLPCGKISACKLKTVTYGTASAPFQATEGLNQLARDEKSKFPLAAKEVKNFAVDNLLTGGNNLNILKETRNQLIEMLKTAGMHLRQWSSNSPILLEDLPSREIEKIIDFENSSCNQFIKVIGITYNPVSDKIQFKNPDLSNLTTSKITKRLVLSIIASIFDPLGLIQPFIIQAKILMQKLWLLQIEWDEELPENEKKEFIKFVEDLKNLTDLQIPRCVTIPEYKSIELHGFADSSIVAYGACLYVRCVYESGESTTTLLTSKSRVCPLKKHTLARMELAAALLLAQLTSRIIKAIPIQFDNVALWSDSTITLHWIQTQPNLLKTFESHRVAEIQKLTSNYKWCHIKSKENPADFITRGQTLRELQANSLWWKGPEFLQNPNYDSAFLITVPNSTNLQTSVSSATTENNRLFIFDDCSSFTVLAKSVAYWLRAVKNAGKPNAERKFGSLSKDETENATNCIVRLAQHEYFQEEIEALKKGKSIKKTSKLKSLLPVLDSNNVLYVTGRLQNANIPSEAQHPQILPANHPLTIAIIRDFHKIHQHAGPQLLLYLVRQQYWPINGKQLTKKIVRDCVTCFRNSPRSTQPVMGSLPDYRVNPHPPFSFSGIDYCGHFLTKNKYQRNGPIFKSYILVIVCLTTSAVHLEVVGDLKTDSFLQALRRFIARRGKPLEIHSDNAKTFEGADNELKAMKELLQESEDDIVRFASENSINWVFIPPYAPNFGGKWESVVKSLKYHLKRVSEDQLFYFEELTTLATEIEGLLNSRPITALSDNPNDPLPLSAGHFLIGRPINFIAEPSLLDINPNLLDRWQRIQQMVQHFWKRWSNEYLNTLQQRKKWVKDSPGLDIGDVVLLQHDFLPPTEWLMGVIIKIHPGKDDRVRVVTVKTPRGDKKRAASKLSKLPIPSVE